MANPDFEGVVAACQQVEHSWNLDAVTQDLGLLGLAAELDASFRDVLKELRWWWGVIREGGVIGNPKYAGLNSLKGSLQLLMAVYLVITLYESGATHNEVARALVREVGPVGAVQVAVALGSAIPGLPTAVRLAVSVGERRVAAGDAAAARSRALLEQLVTLRDAQRGLREQLAE